MQLISRDVEVSGAIIHNEASVIPMLDQSDIIFSQPRARARMGAVLAAYEKKIILFPRIYFAGLHPDIVSVRDDAGDLIHGPLGGYHSLLALYGWMRDLDVGKTAKLFEEAVYRNAGFFDAWKTARRVFAEECAAVDMPTVASLPDTWVQRGAFMYTVNHPRLFVLADLARICLDRLNLNKVCCLAAELVPDSLASGPVWPVYPAIAERLGFEGSYLFKMPDDSSVSILGLEEFVARCFEGYARYDRGAIRCDRLTDLSAIHSIATSAPEAPNRPSRRVSTSPARLHPYANIQRYQRWRQGVANVSPHELDPVTKAGFTISLGQRIATAGSCFAQHIGRILADSLFVVETPVFGEAATFSARYGNIYTARQLVQLFDRAFDIIRPVDSAWLRADGKWADPFRPEIEPDGFSSIEAVEAARTKHLSAVAQLFRELDVLVFTLGLTEAWQSRADRMVYPTAPGVSAGVMDDAHYEFVNFTVEDVVSDIEQFSWKLAGINPLGRIILTVSPVPLIATYEDRHILVSTTYSKSVLRVAAETVARHISQVEYFPSYEIITGNFNRGQYFSSDLRSITSDGVEHVMRVFLNHYMPHRRKAASHFEQEILSGMEIICDEEKLDQHRREAL